MQVINDSEFFSFIIRVMHGAEIGEKTKAQFFIIIEKVEHFQVDLLRRFEREHSIRFIKTRNLLAEFLSQSLFDMFVGQTHINRSRFKSQNSKVKNQKGLTI